MRFYKKLWMYKYDIIVYEEETGRMNVAGIIAAEDYDDIYERLINYYGDNIDAIAIEIIEDTEGAIFEYDSKETPYYSNAKAIGAHLKQKFEKESSGS